MIKFYKKNSLSCKKQEKPKAVSSCETFSSDKDRMPCANAFGFVDNCLSRAFYSYGKFLSRYRLIVLIASLSMVVITGTGVLRLHIEDDVEALFTPEHSPGLSDRQYLKSIFPIGNEGEEFIPNRVLDSFISKLQVIYRGKDGESILREDIMKEILKIDTVVREFSVPSTNESRNYTYNELCMKWLGQCIKNPIVDIFRMKLAGMPLTLTYPVMKLPEFGDIIIGYQLGNVEFVPGTKIVSGAEAVILNYYLSDLPSVEADLWEESVEEMLIKEQDNDENPLLISPCTSWSLPKEANHATQHVLPRFLATFMMLMIFAVVSLMTGDWVVSKPFLGLCGVASAAFAILSSIGTLSFFGLAFNEVVSMMPFLVIGVGVDNMFIMVAAWRQLSLYLPTTERMGRTFSEAAVSITITNLTDVLAFVIGATTPLPGIRMFCAYSGVAMIFAYIYQITFFGACLSYMGDREEKRLHCLTYQKVAPKDQAPNSLYKIFCAGGVIKGNTTLPTRDAFFHHPIMKFFRDYYGPFIMKLPSKVAIVISYFAILGGSIYGCYNTTEGLRLQNLASDNSPTWEFFTLYDKYQSSFSPPIQVIFRDPLPYWDPEVQREVSDIVSTFENSSFVYHKNMTNFWLRHYSQYLMGYIPGQNINKTTFLKILETQFLVDPRFKQYSLDIIFDRDSNGTAVGVTTSRLVLDTTGADSAVKEQELMKEFREKANMAAVNVTAWAPLFVVYDQYVDILPYTFQTLSIAIICMFFVALIMIPHPICAIWVILCIVSIDTCVLGYMALWGVSLDVISMINIVLCIGFSVDFSAHITYSFVIGQSKDPNQRTIWALRGVGMPIIQGSLSSIIAIIPLASASVYIFRTFFKTLFLVMFFGALHGLLFLPVALSMIGRFIPVPDKKAREFSYSIPKSDVRGRQEAESTKRVHELVELVVSTV